MKKCTKCGFPKPLESFSKDRSRKDGLQSKCRQCSSEYKAERKAAGIVVPSHTKEARREYAQKNPDAVKRAKLSWLQRNIESERLRSRQYNQAYYQEHSSAILAQQQRRRLEDPSIQRDSNARHRARKKNAAVENVRSLVVFERDTWVCQLCFLPVDKTLRKLDLMSKSLDHIVPLSKGGEHSYANTQLAHLRCNMKKSDSLDWKPVAVVHPI